LAVAAGLSMTLAACGGGDKKATDTTAPAGASGSTTVVAGSGSGSSTTAPAGAAKGIVTGGKAFVGAFSYTLKSATLAAQDTDPEKQVLSVLFDYENLSKTTVGVNLADYAVKLDGDQNQAAQELKPDPSGDVAPGTKGTLTVKFVVGKSFDPSKVSIVLGDPNSIEAPIVPLGAAGKKESKEAAAKPITASVTGAKNGLTITIDKGALQYTDPFQNQQADRGTVHLALHATIKGGPDDASLANYETKLKEPDGSVVEARALVVDDKSESGVDLSAGQTREVTLVFVVKNKDKVNGAYELSVPTDDGGTAKGAFTVS
jgi:hypothetical protein